MPMITENKAAMALLEKYSSDEKHYAELLVFLGESGLCHNKKLISLLARMKRKLKCP